MEEEQDALARTMKLPSHPPCSPQRHEPPRASSAVAAMEAVRAHDGRVWKAVAAARFSRACEQVEEAVQASPAWAAQSASPRVLLEEEGEVLSASEAVSEAVLEEEPSVWGGPTYLKGAWSGTVLPRERRDSGRKVLE